MQGLPDYIEEGGLQVVQLTTSEVYQQILKPRISVFGSFYHYGFKPKLKSSLLGQEELLRDFLKCFNADTLLVEELETQATVLNLLNELRLVAFNNSLSKHPTRTMDEI